MKFKKLYSSDNFFRPIIFNEDINVVFADGHSVGKTKFLEIIDFCLLKDKFDFLKNNIFKDEKLAFYLEIENFGKYITIKRYLNKKRSIYITTSDKSIDCSLIEDKNFEYHDLGLDRAKEILNSLLDLRINNKKIYYRRYLNYFLRTQDDQSDIFRLNKFKRSKDKDFKPIVADLVGIDGDLIKKKYDLEEKIENIKEQINYILSEIGNTTKEYLEVEINKLEEILTEKEKLYEEFNFYKEEDKKSKELVDEIENEIAKLNKIKISLIREIEYINNALEDEFLIDINEIEAFLNELNLYFPDKLKNNYEKIIEFNKILSKDRKRIMQENKVEFQKKLEKIDDRLIELNKKRQQIVSILLDKDSFSKFKKLEKEIVELKTKIEILKEKLKKFEELDILEQEKEELIQELQEVNKKIKKMINTINKGKFAKLIDKFSQIIFNERAIFVVSLNKNGNLEFKMKVADNDNFENEKDEGHTFRKLLSFLFSLVVLIYHRNDNFFRFNVIDSPFDGDIYRYQKGLFEAINIASKEYNLQIIITTIEDEIKDKEIFKNLKANHEIAYLTEHEKLLGNF